MTDDWADLTVEEKLDQLHAELTDLQDDLESLEARVEVIGECAARADKNRELIEGLDSQLAALANGDLTADGGETDE